MKKTLLFSAFFVVAHVSLAQSWGASGGNILYVSPTVSWVGIGTTTPGYPLDVTGYIHTSSIFISDAQSAGALGVWVRGATTGNANMVLQANAGTAAAYWITADGSNLKLGAHGGSEPATGVLNLTLGGNVGINTTDTKGYMLAVPGSAVFTQAVVKLQANWPDYMFKKNYHLPSLDSIEAYIKRYNHLPGIPTAAEVQKNGLDLGAMNVKVLEKIEQLTLYTIELQKKIDSLQTENAGFTDLQRQIDEIKNKISPK